MTHQLQYLNEADRIIILDKVNLFILYMTNQLTLVGPLIVFMADFISETTFSQIM